MSTILRALRRALRNLGTPTPRGLICPVCHVGHGWHDVDVHDPSAVS